MYCYQCEQTYNGAACVDSGVCGKDGETAALQDLLVSLAKTAGRNAHAARQAGTSTREADQFVIEALFISGTNVNFDAGRIEEVIRRGAKVAGVKLARNRTGLLADARPAAVNARLTRLGPDITGLQELVLYALKGLAAYTEHARHLGREDDAIYAGAHELLALLTERTPSTGALLAGALRAGEINLRAMQLLDDAHTSAFGNPEPASVRLEPLAGKAIAVSGHDINDLYAVLEQSAGKGVNVYTHGELLPAHGYPRLRAFPHLAGNFGGAWVNQGVDFEAFPGSILITANCIQEPRKSYRERIFTSGPSGWPGIRHIGNRDFTPLIEAALAAPGFEADGGATSITVGFAHHTVLSMADRLVDAVNSGAVRHLFLVGGCDGAKPGRDYFTEFAVSTPPDTIVMTLGCGKFRFNWYDFGTVAGLPRLLDIGQCNDAYSAIRIARGLAEAFGCGINELPLSLVLSWFEQKAVAILLTLLHLGVRNIRIGPTLPAFLTPPVFRMLHERFDLQPVGDPAEDLAAMV